MKKVMLLTLCLVILGAAAAMAGTINFAGDIAIGSDAGTYVNPTVIGYSDWFLTKSATYNAGMLTFTTNWNPGKDGTIGPGQSGYNKVYTADLFLGNHNAWNYAIELDYGNGMSNATVYKLPFNITYSNDPSFGFAGIGTYGLYYAHSGWKVPVEATGTNTTTTTVTWTYGPLSTDGNNTDINNTVAINLNGILTSAVPLDFVWGTTTCANGPVYVPLPPTALLLGSSLLGLAGLRRRKRMGSEFLS